MSVKTLSTAEFQHDLDGAQQAAKQGPVFITEDGRPELVLLSIEDYTRIARSGVDLSDLLSSHEAAGVEFEPPRMNFQAQRVTFD